jgi:hypothetical protein
MKKTFAFIFITLAISNLSFGQLEPVIVSEQTIKVSQEKELYFSFAEGDEIIFNLDVVKGKNIKEVEITEYPYTSKFFDFKTKKVSDQRIKVNKTAIYKFRIKGGGMSTKICRVKILRVPGNKNNRNFDTSVKWKVLLDSTYVNKQTIDLSSIDTNIVSLVNKVERVHSQYNLDNPNRTNFNFYLPTNEQSELQSTELISWAYWLGVGDEGLNAFEQDKKNFLLENTSTVGAMVDPLAGLALGTYIMLTNPPEGDNVKYWITSQYDGTVYTIAQGNSVVANERITTVKQGGFTVTFDNDNLVDGINVNFKVTAVIVTKKYVKRNYKELVVKRIKYPVVSTSE